MQTYLGAVIVATALAGVTGNAIAQEVIRASGGSIRTPLGYGIVMNEASTLEREWIVINIPEVPATLHDPTGVKTVYKTGDTYSRGEYRYEAKFAFTAKEALVAVEIRFLVFDVWGKQSRLLSATYVEDIEKGAKVSRTGKWSLYSENEAEEHYASIGYVARARTKSGEIRIMPSEHVLKVAHEFSADISEKDLEPKESSPN